MDTPPARSENEPTAFRTGAELGQPGITLSREQSSVAVPVLSRLSRSTGNSGKLVAAKTLLRVVRSVFRDRLATVLLDSWYMRKTLIKPAPNMGYQVIGQVRKDTALYLPPPPHNGKRGRPRKYGSKLIPETVAALPETTRQLFLFTAGRMRLGLQRIFAQVDIRSLWNPKSGKFGPTKGMVRDKQPPEVEKAA